MVLSNIRNEPVFKVNSTNKPRWFNRYFDVFLFGLIYSWNTWILAEIWEIQFSFVHAHSVSKNFRPTSKFYKPMQLTRSIQLFAIHPCNPCNPINLAESFEIYLTWKIRHIIIEIFWPKTSETNYSYYCLSKKLMKSYHTEVVWIFQNMFGYSF